MSALAFAGRKAIVLHRPDNHRAALETQLARIGLSVRCVMPTAGRRLDADVVIFDADLGHQELFPWGRKHPPMPLVAIVGSEAPGRIEWALAQSATAFLRKPIGSDGAFLALTAAFRLHDQIRQLLHAKDDLTDRVRARPLVVRAILEIMSRQGLDEMQAVSELRRAAMERRTSIEALSAAISATPRLADTLQARLAADTPELAPQTLISKDR